MQWKWLSVTLYTLLHNYRVQTAPGHKVYTPLKPSILFENPAVPGRRASTYLPVLSLLRQVSAWPGIKPGASSARGNGLLQWRIYSLEWVDLSTGSKGPGALENKKYVKTNNMRLAFPKLYSIEWI